MGRKNQMKRLLMGKSNKEVESDIMGLFNFFFNLILYSFIYTALTYILNGLSREIFLNLDVNDKNALVIVNVPYYIDGVKK
jgi:hypothetical protein